ARGQRMTLQGPVLVGVSDAPADARRLARRLQGLRSKVNLIPFNTWEGAAFRRPAVERILAFQRVLLDARLTATVRWSKGEDVGAACGQLYLPDRGPDAGGGRGPRAGGRDPLIESIGAGARHRCLRHA